MNINGIEKELIMKRTNSDDPDFLNLIIHLDADLKSRYGDFQSFFDQFNTLTQIKNVMVAYIDGIAVGCGAFKEFEPGVIEVKRMFVDAALRGNGIAGHLLHHLEAWAAELGYRHAILETGYKQEEAIRAYLKKGYVVTENFGDYIGIKESVCMRKRLEPAK